MKKILFLMLCAIMICTIGCSKEDASEQQNNNSTQNGNQNNSGNQNGSGNQNNDIQNQINELFGDEATIQKKCEETFCNQIGEAEYYCDHRRDNEALYAAYYPNDMVIIFKIKLKEIEIIDLINRDMPTDTLDWYLPPYIKYNNENLKVVKIDIQEEKEYLENYKIQKYPAKNIYMPNTIRDVESLYDANPINVFFSNSVMIVNKYCFSIGQSVYYGECNIKYVKMPENLKTLPDFSYSENLEAIILPKNVESIYLGNCHQLKTIDIPNSVTRLHLSSSKITSITIPNSVTSLDLSGCTGLTTIDIPNSVTYLDLSGCRGLTSIDIPNSVTYLELCYCNSASINIPNSVTELHFRACTDLTSITIPNCVTSIESGAFAECTNLTSITIPNSVTSIGEYAFGACTDLTSITIPNSVTEIGSHAFYGCTGLTSITIPNSVTSIGYRAFDNCTNLTSIKLNGDFYDAIFYDEIAHIPNLKTIYIKEGVKILDYFNNSKYTIIRF